MRRRRPVDRDELQIGMRARRVKRLTPVRKSGLCASMQEKRIHQIFVVSVLFKGAHALFEIVGGIALYLISTEAIVSTINRFSRDQLVEDPDDWVGTHLLNFAQHFSV